MFYQKNKNKFLTWKKNIKDYKYTNSFLKKTYEKNYISYNFIFNIFQ